MISRFAIALTAVVACVAATSGSAHAADARGSIFYAGPIPAKLAATDSHVVWTKADRRMRVRSLYVSTIPNRRARRIFNGNAEIQSVQAGGKTAALELRDGRIVAVNLVTGQSRTLIAGDTSRFEALKAASFAELPICKPFLWLRDVAANGAVIVAATRTLTRRCGDDSEGRLVQVIRFIEDSSLPVLDERSELLGGESIADSVFASAVGDGVAVWDSDVLAPAELYMPGSSPAALPWAGGEVTSFQSAEATHLVTESVSRSEDQTDNFAYLIAPDGKTARSKVRETGERGARLCGATVLVADYKDGFFRGERLASLTAVSPSGSRQTIWKSRKSVAASFDCNQNYGVISGSGAPSYVKLP